MRAVITAAFFALLLCSCSDKMQRLEAAGSAVKKCIDNCSLNTPSVSDIKQDAVKTGVVAEEKQGGVDRVQNIWGSRFHMW
ncbi:MAG TPA: hypothetical protein VHB48_05760 [Chitinophagaceae bacterium]|jgi:hypothetical protein|nr:hypothetical protein [Chitinophagaceae bacterium]